MINDKSFLEKHPSPEEGLMETGRTKEEAQQELKERFGLENTEDFQAALQRGETELAERWLNHIVANKPNFPQFATTWDAWLSDRRNEIVYYRRLKDEGSLGKMEWRTKEAAQQELVEMFGLKKTSDFQLALQRGETGLAEQWLNHIVANKLKFPQYIGCWDRWLEDRQRELAEAKK